MDARTKKARTAGAADLWYKDAIIYQLHVKSFFDSNNDGIGDFPGLISKLDYQLSPIVGFGALTAQANEQVSLNWLSTIRARAGFAVAERLAVFATGRTSYR